MFLTIAGGDVVKVKICIDGDVIKTGFQNSSQPRDIIVFCVGVTIPYNSQPSSICVGHRPSKNT